MAYTVRVERVGFTGIPQGTVAFYEVVSAIVAVTIATYEADAHRSGQQRVAKVFDATGTLVLAYAGRARASAAEIRGR